MYEANLTNRVQIAGEVKGWIQENKGIVNQYIISQVSGLLGRQASVTETPLTQQEYRQRKVLLSKVKEFWIEGVLEKSLHTRVAIALGLEERLDAVERPFNSLEELPAEPRQRLPTGTGATDVFDRMEEGRTLLILGEPGAGKTTTFLKLAQNLINSTEQDLSRPIPVVLNLSSWGNKRQAIAHWLIEELNSKYQVSKALGQVWIDKQQLLLLLDGLDEVKVERREACVQAINQFLQEHGQTEIVVCSRIQDYEALSTRLQLRGAICIQSLTPEQVNQYLDEAGKRMEAVKSLLQEDPALQQLAKSPLMLSVMTLAYQDISLAILPKTGSVEARRQHLFDAYIERMFQRKGAKQQYSKEQVTRWLTWLAKRMSQTSQTVFLIEQMQPAWLENKTQKIFYELGSVAIAGLIFGTIGLLSGKWLGGLVGLLSVGVALLLPRKKSAIETVETLRWSWEEAKKIASHKLDCGLILGAIFGLSLWLMGQVKGGLTGGLLLGLIYGLNGAFILTLIGGLRGRAIETKTIPNQGIWRSLTNALIVGAIGGLIGGLLGWLIGVLILGFNYWLWFGLIYGLTIGASLGGGKACIQHVTLRSILSWNSYIPWNYERFLDYASDRIFLQKVGGGYIFIHRMLLEHFAHGETSRLSDRAKASIKHNSSDIHRTATQPSTPVQHDLFCSNCGHKNSANFNFCTKCGTRLITK